MLRTAHEKPLRVLHIGKYFPPHAGGMETYLQDLMVVQHRQGQKVTAIVHAFSATGFDRDQQVDALDGTSFKVRLAARWFNLGFVPVSPFFWLSALKLIRQFKPNIIHIHHPNLSAAWLLLLPLARKVPWVAHWHSDILTPSSSRFVRFCYAFYRPVEQQLLKLSTIIFATSSSYVEDSEALAKHLSKVEVLPLGLDTRRLPDPDQVQQMDRPKGSPLVLFLGRLAGYKGLPTLLNAVAQLPNVHCWLVGDGSERRILEDEVARLKIQDRVRFVGAVNEKNKWRYLKTADVVVLPSTDKNEAFGMVILEAGHLDKSMVVTDIDGSGTAWVASQFGATVVAARDLCALTAGIRQVLSMPPRESKGVPSADGGPFNLATQSREIIDHYRSIDS
ncbi:MAG: glycosyltransferase [Luminiphilus sp.]|nr:glycosyltransferase [Luminiphilus sp.]